MHETTREQNIFEKKIVFESFFFHSILQIQFEHIYKFTVDACTHWKNIIFYLNPQIVCELSILLFHFSLFVCFFFLFVEFFVFLLMISTPAFPVNLDCGCSRTKFFRNSSSGDCLQTLLQFYYVCSQKRFQLNFSCILHFLPFAIFFPFFSFSFCFSFFFFVCVCLHSNLIRANGWITVKYWVSWNSFFPLLFSFERNENYLYTTIDFHQNDRFWKVSTFQYPIPLCYGSCCITVIRPKNAVTAS